MSTVAVASLRVPWDLLIGLKIMTFEFYLSASLGYYHSDYRLLDSLYTPSTLSGPSVDRSIPILAARRVDPSNIVELVGMRRLYPLDYTPPTALPTVPLLCETSMISPGGPGHLPLSTCPWAAPAGRSHRLCIGRGHVVHPSNRRHHGPSVS